VGFERSPVCSLDPLERTALPPAVGAIGNGRTVELVGG
jgi:hypothetical protein